MKKIKWYSFLWIPLIYFLSILPAWAEGNSLGSLLQIYFLQSQYYKVLNLNIPNIYSWLPANHYNELYLPSLCLAIGVTLMIMDSIISHTKDMTNKKLVIMAFLFTVLMPFILPKMHDRYYYLADILSIIYAVSQPKRLFVPILMVLTSLFSYSPFLFGTPPAIPFNYLAFVPFALILMSLYDLVGNNIEHDFFANNTVRKNN